MGVVDPRLRLKMFLLRELQQLMGIEEFWSCLRDDACSSRVRDFIEYNLGLLRRRFDTLGDWVIKLGRYVIFGRYFEDLSIEFRICVDGVRLRVCAEDRVFGCVEV